MSFSYHCTVFALPQKELPSSFETVDEQQSFIIEQQNRAHAALEKLEPRHHALPRKDWIKLSEQVLRSTLVLCGSSRGGWFERVMGAIIRAYGAKSLEFITDAEQHAPFIWPDPTWRFRSTSIEPQDIPAVAQEIRSGISWCEENAALVGELSSDGFLAEDVLEAVESHDVTFDASSYAYEGEGFNYLFVFLRSLLVILDEARARGLVVVVYQQHP